MHLGLGGLGCGDAEIGGFVMVITGAAGNFTSVGSLLADEALCAVAVFITVSLAHRELAFG